MNLEQALEAKSQDKSDLTIVSYKTPLDWLKILTSYCCNQSFYLLSMYKHIHYFIVWIGLYIMLS